MKPVISITDIPSRSLDFQTTVAFAVGSIGPDSFQNANVKRLRRYCKQ